MLKVFIATRIDKVDWDECDYKTEVLRGISLEIDCITYSLMYSNYIDDIM